MEYEDVKINFKLSELKKTRNLQDYEKCELPYLKTELRLNKRPTKQLKNHTT